VRQIQEHQLFALVLPAWAILDFWRTANEEIVVFVLTRRELQVERLSFPVENPRFSDHLNDLTSVRCWRAVDEGLGLMNAFLLRGAGLVLATQWSVVDACANQMLLTFVERYLAGADPVVALRKAQRQMRELPAEAIVRHCQDVLAQCPETSRPHEAINICALAVRVCKRNNRLDDAADWFRQLANLRRQIGQPLDDEEETYAHLRKCKGTADAQWRGPANFDHPIFWGAFQFVGRVVRKHQPQTAHSRKNG
jgi:hypothetical protein